MPPVPSFEIASKTFGGSDHTEKTSLDWELGLRSPAFSSNKTTGRKKEKSLTSVSLSLSPLSHVHTHIHAIRKTSSSKCSSN